MKKLFFLVLLVISVMAKAGTADSLIKKLRTMEDDTNKVTLLTKIGRELLYSDAKKALAYADSAEQLAKKLSYRRGICRAYIVKGIYYRNAGIYDKGFSYQSEAIKIAEEMNDKKLIASGYTNLGILFKNQGNYKKAIGYMKESLERSTELKDTIAMANCYQNLSNSYRRDRQPDMAIKSSLEAFKLFESQKDNYGIMSAYSSLGAVYMEDKKDYEKALAYFKKAEEIVNRKSDMNGRAVAYQNLGDCYYLMKNYKLAEEYTKKSLDAGKLINNTEQEATNYLNLSRIMEAQGNLKQAFNYYKKYNELNDSLAKSRYQQSTLEMEEKFHSEKSEKEIELLSNLNLLQTKENEAQKNQLKMNRIILFCSVGIGAIITVLAFLFYRNFKKTEKLNSLLSTKNNQIEYQKKEILDSILYARRIQDSILPQDEELKHAVPKNFVIYKPRDIVSGDFYWTYKAKSGKSVIALCDCTGHGVPGAFMSLISYTILNHVIKDTSTDSPDKVLNFLSAELPVALKSGGAATDLRDGLDIAVAEIDYEAKQLRCSMAHIPIYVCNGKELTFLKPDKQSISADNYNKDFKFSIQSFSLNKGDKIYLCTDGFADQFGGPKGKKLKYKELEKLLLETHSLNLEEQKKKIEHVFENWKSNLEQVDDVTLIGIEV